VNWFEYKLRIQTIYILSPSVLENETEAHKKSKATAELLSYPQILLAEIYNS
jgi:hypothetical protein